MRIGNMSVTIKIQHVRESEVFYPGEEVAGLVEIRGLTIPDSTINVRLSGRTTTEMRRDQYSRLGDTQTFFQIAQVLHQGKLKVTGDEVQEYTFKFTIPLQTEPSWGVSHIKPYKKRADVFAQTPHPVPFSVWLSGSFVSPWMAEVVYEIYAEAKGRRLLRYQQGIITVVPSPAHNDYIVSQAQESQQNSNKSFTHVAFFSRAQTTSIEKRASMKTWLGDKVSADKPKAVFYLTVRTATVVGPGHSIPIQITLQYDADTSTVPSMPDVHLLEVKYKIKAVTDTVHRCNSILVPTTHNTDTYTVFKRHLRFANMTLVNGATTDIGYVDTENGGMHYIPLDNIVTPPFITYNISRQYFIEITASFKCGNNKVSSAVFKWEHVGILYNEGFKAQNTALGDKDDDRTMQGALRTAGAITIGALSILAAFGGG